MRHFILLAAVILFITNGALADAPIAQDALATKAAFSVDNSTLALTSAVATVEPRAGAPGYSWVRINFYSFAPSTEDMPGIGKGDVSSMDKKWQNLGSGYNTGNAVIQLSVDMDFKVWQVDMAVPGHSCTIAPTEKDLKNFLQDYQFDGHHLKLKSKGSYICDMSFMKAPDQTYAWDIDLDTPVFKKE